MEFEKIKEIIVQMLNVEVEDITMEASLAETFGADSLQIFEMILRLQETFSITFEEDAIEKMEYVEDIVKYIQNIKN